MNREHARKAMLVYRTARAARKNIARAALEAGYSIAEIARRMEVNETTVYRWLEEIRGKTT